jgi:uncharacterized repeat protein (TIGR03806 family)
MSYKHRRRCNCALARPWLVGLAVLLLFGSCSPDASSSADVARKDWPEIAFDPDSKAPSKLSLTGLAKLVNGELVYNPNLIGYQLNIPLFSDYAVKRRALWLPEGEVITWRPDGPLGFARGSIIVKSFLFPKDMRTPDVNVRAIETRVLVRGDTSWSAWPYIWDAEGGDATLKVAGGVKQITFIDEKGEPRTSSYLVPQRNQCLDCHEQLDGDQSRTDIIGPQARLLNRDNIYNGEVVNQLKHLELLGLLPQLPPLNSISRATSWAKLRAQGVGNLQGEPLDVAARDYLDINCAHCHSPNAVEGQTSQLYLNWDNGNDFSMGVCKAPSSAGHGGLGRKWDIVPGEPDESILVYRLETTKLGAMMPDLGRSLPHDRGIELVRAWIQQMPTVTCNR